MKRRTFVKTASISAVGASVLQGRAECSERGKGKNIYMLKNQGPEANGSFLLNRKTVVSL